MQTTYYDSIISIIIIIATDERNSNKNKTFPRQTHATSLILQLNATAHSLTYSITHSIANKIPISITFIWKIGSHSAVCSSTTILVAVENHQSFTVPTQFSKRFHTFFHAKTKKWSHKFTVIYSECVILVGMPIQSYVSNQIKWSIKNKGTVMGVCVWLNKNYFIVEFDALKW